MYWKFARLIAAAAGIAAAQSAFAADIPAAMPTKAPPVAVVAYNWSGFYIGANGGYGWSRNRWAWTGAGAGFDGSFTGSGGLAGGQVGFNWQTGNWVFGVEGSGDWASIKGSGQSVLFGQDINNTKITSLYTVTGRAGYAWDRTLLYVKGGGAWARERHFGSCNGLFAFCVPAGFVYATASETRSGWTVGAGVEYGLTPNLSVAAEYDYVDFGSRDVTLVATPTGGCGAPCTWNIKQQLHLVTARLNWRFGPLR